MELYILLLVCLENILNCGDVYNDTSTLQLMYVVVKL